ncbi:MAG: hypothetical protein ACE360_04120 [Hyphomicrobiales bacterium]
MSYDDGKKPWFQRRLQAFHERTDELKREREIAESFQEHPQDRSAREQAERYNADLYHRATSRWWANREERQYVKDIKQFSPEIRDQLIGELIRERMALLEEKDRQADLKRSMPNPNRRLRERLGQMVRGEREH